MLNLDTSGHFQLDIVYQSALGIVAHIKYTPDIFLNEPASDADLNAIFDVTKIDGRMLIYS